MKILSAAQIKSLDQFTIEQEPIASIDLMERASLACFRRLVRWLKPNEPILIICGTGNNGGDGLAITRMLLDNQFDCKACVIRHKNDLSADAQKNYERLEQKYPTKVFNVSNKEDFLSHSETCEVAIDALFGSGLNKAVDGLCAEVIKATNAHFQKIISIDVPSGLFIDKSSSENEHIIHSTLTLSLQFPKLGFLLPENKNYVPEFELVDIGLHNDGIAQHGTSYHYITKQLVQSLLKKRNKFSHKGTYGHALLLAGSKGKSGAALIASKACLRSGAGLLTLHSNANAIAALLQQLPEAMSECDSHSDYISELEKPERFDAVAFGPGVGLHEDSKLVLKKLLNYYSGKLVIDADGLNMLSENKTWLNFLPPNTILTPHPKEFERLSEKVDNDFEGLELLKQFSIKTNCIVLLKGAHTAIAMPDGHVFFNSSGNAGLAKGASGDGLTGIILGLLCRGYSAPQAALIGTFVHGYAADLCLKKKSVESLLISDVIEMLPKAFKKLEEFN